jgi:hypothetical protein
MPALFIELLSLNSYPSRYPDLHDNPVRLTREASSVHSVILPLPPLPAPGGRKYYVTIRYGLVETLSLTLTAVIPCYCSRWPQALRTVHSPLLWRSVS